MMDRGKAEYGGGQCGQANLSYEELLPSKLHLLFTLY